MQSSVHSGVLPAWPTVHNRVKQPLGGGVALHSSAGLVPGSGSAVDGINETFQTGALALQAGEFTCNFHSEKVTCFHKGH